MIVKIRYLEEKCQNTEELKETLENKLKSQMSHAKEMKNKLEASVQEYKNKCVHLKTLLHHEKSERLKAERKSTSASDKVLFC